MSFNWKTKTADESAKFVVTMQGRIAQRRAVQDDIKALVVKIFRPRSYDILGNCEKGKQYGQNIYDQHPANALNKFVSGKIGYMVSRQVPWIGLVPTQRSLLRSDAVKQYTQDASEQILYAAGRSTLYSALYPHGMDAHSVGTSCMVPMRDRKKDRVVFDVVHPRDSFIGIDKYGDAIIYHRTQTMTNLTALEMFDRRKLPDNWFKDNSAESNDLKEPFEEHKYIWAVYPNDDRYNNSARNVDKKYKVMCVLLGEKDNRLVLDSGDNIFPICWRSLRETGFEYGTSIAMDCLTTALYTNKLGEKNLLAAHLAVDPRKLASSTLRRTLHDNPGGTTWTDDIQREDVKTWGDRIQWPTADAQMVRLNADIDDRMYIRFFEMLSSGELSKVKTAYEVSQMMGEKATLMSAIVDTFEQECLEPCIGVLIEEETAAGRMPEVPDELIESGGKVNIRYIGPLHQLQQTLLRGKSITDAVAVIEQMAVLDSFVPIKFNFMEMAEEVTVSGGLPQRMVKSDEEVRKIIEETNQRQQATEQAEMAQKAASAAGSLSGSVAPDSVLAGIGAVS